MTTLTATPKRVLQSIRATYVVSPAHDESLAASLNRDDYESATDAERSEADSYIVDCTSLLPDVAFRMMSEFNRPALEGEAANDWSVLGSKTTGQVITRVGYALSDLSSAREWRDRDPAAADIHYRSAIGWLTSARLAIRQWADDAADLINANS